MHNTGRSHDNAKAGLKAISDCSRTRARIGLAIALSAVTLSAPQVFAQSSSSPAEIAPTTAEQADYRFSAVKVEGAVVLNGTVPSKPYLDKLQQTLSVDASGVSVASGAVPEFERAIDFGLRVLSQLKDGRFSLRSNVLTIKGTALSAKSFEQAQTLVQIGAPQGVVVALAEIEPPLANPFIWSASLEPDGTMNLAGYVPDADTRTRLASDAGEAAVAGLSYGGGAPDGFAAQAVAGLDLLKTLRAGKASFDGTNWLLTGELKSGETRAEFEAAAKTAGLDADGWTIDVAEAGGTQENAPEVASAPANDEFTPQTYTWSATKTGDGAISLKGFVPSEGFRKFLSSRAGAVTANDSTAVAAGAPDDFSDIAVAGFVALSGLTEGSFGLDEGKWSLVGTAPTEAARESILSTLKFATETDDWNIDIDVAAEAASAAPNPESTEETDADQAQAQAPAGASQSYEFVASKSAGQPISLAGDVPAEATKGFLGVAAGNASTDGLKIVPGAPETFVLDVKNGVQALAGLDEGRLELNNGKWSLSGRAGTIEDRDGALKLVAGAPTGESWSVAVDGPSGIDACRTDVAALMANNQILFAPASAQMTDASVTTVSTIADMLKSCPDAYVYVEGHTDSDGDDRANLALSVARAEAVTDVLRSHAVKDDRLYVVGYGESQPVADNATAEGRQANRRIVFSILDKPLD